MVAVDEEVSLAQYILVSLKCFFSPRASQRPRRNGLPMDELKQILRAGR